MQNAELIFYILLAIIAVSWYTIANRRRHRRDIKRLNEARQSGLTEPASLHPIIDPALCLACGACVDACPEGEILGLIDGRAQLVDPTSCIGHGACRAACPFDAITLVFGSATRGVDIPHVGPDFQTNVPGLFIAGELGGMGLIRNAVEQGRQAMDSVAKRRGGKGAMLDVVIIGAGPAGFAASLAAMEKKLRFATIEQETLGGTVAHFPRGKLVMTQPAILPLVGRMRFRETTKEQLMDFWRDVERKTGVKVSYQERVDAVTPDGEGFEVTTTKRVLQARSVLLTIGRRGTPRKLGVPGEDAESVVYRLDDPEQYRGKRVLVVGGGDSAIEAAVTLGEEKVETTLSYRGDAFSRIKPKNRRRIEKAEADGTVRVLLKSNVKRINPGAVEIEVDGRVGRIGADAVIVQAGGVLPTGFLKSMGVTVETKHGEA